MSGNRKKKAAPKPIINTNKEEAVNSPVSTITASSAVLNQTADALPIGDPFERMLTTPKESLIQRAASPRRATASPLKAKGKAEVYLEQLPKISGNKRKGEGLILIIFIFIFIKKLIQL